jgi:hypothetical protein
LLILVEIDIASIAAGQVVVEQVRREQNLFSRQKRRAIKKGRP